MRILFLTQVWPYPIDAGPKARAYYTLKHLASRGHALTLVSFVRESDTPAVVDPMQSICEHIQTVPMRRSLWRDGLALGRSLLTGEPLLITRDRRAAMRQTIEDCLRAGRFAAIHADQLWMAPYALAGRQFAQRSGPPPRLVLDQHNAVYLIPERMAAAARHPLARWAYWRERQRLMRYEAQTCLAFDHVVTVTDNDRDALLRLFENGRRPRLAGTIPICLDAEAVRPVARPTGRAELLFVGGMHWPPNADGVTWFAANVLARVRDAVPAARLTAVGKQPPRGLTDGAAGSRLHLPGYVADLQPYWDQCSVFIVPLRVGGGMRVKILDAWAHGVPVVSTTVGAEGLAGTDGVDLLLADTETDFAGAVIRVLTDPALAARLARGGRATMEQRYHWRTAYAAWDAIYPPGD